MDEIKRDTYLNQLLSYRWDGQIKVITGIRRCGKSYLLEKIYKNYLLHEGVKESSIISIQLDLIKDIRFRNPLELSEYITKMTENKDEKFYLFIDEIQMSDEVSNPYLPEGKKITFYDVLNELREASNLDVYVTGSNSKMLSSDILTEFRGRSDEIRVHPLSFSEFYSAVKGDKEDALEQYAFYGGMPFVITRPDDVTKMKYLESLFSETYLKDIIERNNLMREDALENILDFLSSSIGSLTNPKKITDTMNTKKSIRISQNTVASYIHYLEEAFLFAKAKRYDVKGKSYFDYPYKYYCEDIGLRNARIGFRQQEMTHIMENIIYNELIIRGFSVDVGVVYAREQNKHHNSVRIPREIDFVVNSGGKKTYIQSAFALGTDEKVTQELRPFSLTGDNFPKVIVRKDIKKRWYDDNGILNIGLIDFLLDATVV